MGNIVSEAQERLAHMLESNQAEINVPPQWPKAIGYGPWVEEVWVNYISNGVKYGGQPPRLKLGARELTNGSICFWIQDNGTGLTPEEQDKLFTPFTQLNKVRANGHGLGLSIVQRIVKKLNGQVGIVSQVGRGSIFTFTLPAANGLERKQLTQPEG
jgi:signal transduction histidine kinase